MKKLLLMLLAMIVIVAAGAWVGHKVFYTPIPPSTTEGSVVTAGEGCGLPPLPPIDDAIVANLSGLTGIILGSVSALMLAIIFLLIYGKRLESVWNEEVEVSA